MDWIATHRSQILLSRSLLRCRRLPLFCCSSLYLSILAVSLLNRTTDKYGSQVQIFIDKINSKRLDYSKRKCQTVLTANMPLVTTTVRAFGSPTYVTKLIELFNIWRYNSFEHNYFINIQWIWPMAIVRWHNFLKRYWSVWPTILRYFSFNKLKISNFFSFWHCRHQFNSFI